MGWLGGGTTTVEPGTEVGCSQPSVQVITEVTVIVLVEVTGWVIVDEPVTIVVQDTANIST